MQITTVKEQSQCGDQSPYDVPSIMTSMLMWSLVSAEISHSMMYPLIISMCSPRILCHELVCMKGQESDCSWNVSLQRDSD